MLSTSRWGLHLPGVLELQELDLSRALLEEQKEEEPSGRTATCEEEVKVEVEVEEVEDGGSVGLWMILLMVPFRSRRRRPEEEEEEEGLRSWRGTRCSFSVSPGGETRLNFDP